MTAMDTIAVDIAFKEVKKTKSFPDSQVNMAFNTILQVLNKPSYSVLLVSKLIKRPQDDIIRVLDNKIFLDGVHYFSSPDEDGIQITSKGLIPIAGLVLEDTVFTSAITTLISKMQNVVCHTIKYIEDKIIFPVYDDPLAMEFVQLIDADFKSAMSMSAQYVYNFLKSTNITCELRDYTRAVLAYMLNSQAGSEPTVSTRKLKVYEVIRDTTI
jgi:hypothetical protein